MGQEKDDDAFLASRKTKTFTFTYTWYRINLMFIEMVLTDAIHPILTIASYLISKTKDNINM